MLFNNKLSKKKVLETKKRTEGSVRDARIFETKLVELILQQENRFYYLLCTSVAKVNDTWCLIPYILTTEDENREHIESIGILFLSIK